LYDELRALRARADAARRDAGLRPSSQDETERMLRGKPYSVADFRGQRLSDWLPDDFAKARTPAPGSLGAVVGLARLWSGQAGLPEPSVRYWADLLEAAQPPRPGRGRGLPATPGAEPARPLDDYLAAAVRAAREHPYPGVFPGHTPPLAEVYVRQRVRLEDEQAKPAETGALRPGVTAHLREPASPVVPVERPRRPAGRMSADEVLAGHRICVIVGSPGGGKTSLFRTHLIRAVEARERGELDTLLPVLVPAAALVGRPLAAALADAVTADLSSFGLLEKVPDDLFKRCPYEDVPWLVLVDGLDEITDPASRRNLLAALDQISEGSHGRHYRFVIASRPLPDWELAVLGPQAPIYELEPFTWADLHRVSVSWFRVLGLEDPDGVAERFADAIRRTRVFGLAKTPLMAALLCQLHGTSPDAPLPASRGDIYRRYVEQLIRRMQSADASGIQAQVQVTMARYGDEALADGWRTLELLPELISRLAAGLRDGSSRSVLDAVADLPGAECPKRVPTAVWREHLQALLQRSGLLVPRGGELFFFHQTVVEYLAAVAATRSTVASLETLAALFGPRSSLRLFGRPLAFFRWAWVPPDAEASFAGFVLDQCGPAREAVTRHLLRLVRRGGLSGCEFLVSAIRLGTEIPPEVVEVVTELLVDHAWKSGVSTHASYFRRGRDRARFENAFRAIRLLAALGTERAMRQLAVIAGDDVLDAAVRAKAAEAVADLDVAVAVRLLTGLALEPALDARMRTTLAARTAALAPGQASELLARLARDATLPARDRVASVMILRTLDVPRSSTLLAELAADAGLNGYSRVRSAGILAGAGEIRGIELLEELARATEIPVYVREESIRSLVEHGDSTARDVLSRLAADAALDPRVGIRAAGALAGSGDLGALPGLERIARQETSDNNVRISAAEILASLDRYDATALLEDLVRSRTLDDGGRLRILEIMLRVNGGRAAGIVKSLVDDSSLGDRARVSVTGLLAAIDELTAVRIWIEFVGNRQMAGAARADAAEELAQFLLGERPRPSPTVDFGAHPADGFRLDPVGPLDVERLSIADLIDDLSRDRSVAKPDRDRAFAVLRRLTLARR
jgi:hypothetical protein